MHVLVIFAHPRRASFTGEQADAFCAGLREAHRKVMVEDRLLGVGIPEAGLELLGGLSGNDPQVRARLKARAEGLGRRF
jgi:FMN-dependent NADH-azoreductase